MLIPPFEIIPTVAFISQIDRLRIYFISKFRIFPVVNVFFWIVIQVGHQCQAHTILLSVYVLFSLPHSTLPRALKGVHWPFAGEQWCVFSGVSVCCVPVSLGLGCCVETLAADGQP